MKVVSALCRVRILRGCLARLPQPSVVSDNNEANMRGSTNRSPCEAVQSERATRNEVPLSTSRNRLALVRPAAASVRGKSRGEARIHFASLAARGRLLRRPHNVRTRLYVLLRKGCDKAVKRKAKQYDWL
jgi:hypothetical protein